MRKELTLQRASLAAMGLGLGLIVQPWSHALFAAGFPFTLIALTGYNAAGWLSGDRAAKERELARIAQAAQASIDKGGAASLRGGPSADGSAA
jgi:hypothetical protein